MSFNIVPKYITPKYVATNMIPMCIADDINIMYFNIEKMLSQLCKSWTISDNDNRHIKFSEIISKFTYAYTVSTGHPHKPLPYSKLISINEKWYEMSDKLKLEQMEEIRTNISEYNALKPYSNNYYENIVKIEKVLTE